jgi:hypothetical protein
MKVLVFCIFAMALGAAAGTSSAGSAGMRVQSSESLPPAGEIGYGVANLTDRDIRTAWCVKENTGRPVWFSLHFEQPTRLRTLGWFGGYQKNSPIFRANARTRTIAAYADGRLLGRFGLDDRMGLQRVELGGEQASEYKFVIEAVYPGTKYDDLCVTEVLRDGRSVDGYLLADTLARDAGNRALSDAEIKEQYNEIFSFWRSFFNDKWGPVEPEYDRPFWNAVALRTSVRDEGSLRFLLNLRHSAQQQRIASVELTEGLRDLVIGYFEDNPSVVADVWEDENQAERATIDNAYYMFADPWGSKARETVRRYRATNPGFDRFVGGVCKARGAAYSGAPYFCGQD